MNCQTCGQPVEMDYKCKPCGVWLYNSCKNCHKKLDKLDRLEFMLDALQASITAAREDLKLFGLNKQHGVFRANADSADLVLTISKMQDEREKLLKKIGKLKQEMQ